MNDEYKIYAEWAARRESAAQCAERMQQMMHDFASCHELLSHWNQKADSFAEAMELRITPTREHLAPLFDPIEPIEGEKPEDLGFSFGCWNGISDSNLQASLLMFCGNIDTQGGGPNRVFLKLPWLSSKTETLYQPEVLERIMRALVNAWEPSSAELRSYLYNEQYKPSKGIPGEPPSVGWFTYLSADRLGKLSGTPPCDEVVTIPNRGSLFIISREHLFSIDNPDDVARIHALSAYLKENHALEPLPLQRPPRRVRHKRHR